MDEKALKGESAEEVAASKTQHPKNGDCRTGAWRGVTERCAVLSLEAWRG